MNISGFNVVRVTEAPYTVWTYRPTHRVVCVVKGVYSGVKATVRLVVESFATHVAVCKVCNAPA